VVETSNDEGEKKETGKILTCMWLENTIDSLQNSVESFGKMNVTMLIWFMRMRSAVNINVPEGIDTRKIEWDMEDALKELTKVYDSACKR